MRQKLFQQITAKALSCFAILLPTMIWAAPITYDFGDVLVTTRNVSGVSYSAVADKASPNLYLRKNTDGPNPWQVLDTGLKSAEGLVLASIGEDPLAAVSSVMENRGHYVDLSDDFQPVPYFSSGVGPGSTTVFADDSGEFPPKLVLGTRLNGNGTGTVDALPFGLLPGGEVIPPLSLDVPGRVAFLQEVELGSTEVLLVLDEISEGGDPDEADARVARILGVGYEEFDERLAFGLAGDARIMGTSLGEPFQDALLTLISYVPGATTLTVRPVGGSASAPSIDSPLDFPVPVPLGHLIRLDEETGADLLAISDDGAQAFLLHFDNDGLQIADSLAITASLGKPIAIPVPGGFSLLSGNNSDQFVDYAVAGGQATQLRTGTLPDAGGTTPFANLFLFDNNPFVAEESLLVGRLRARDWSVDAVVASGVVEVDAQDFASSEDGLTGAFQEQLLPLPQNAGYALVNQFASDISIVGLQSARRLSPVSVEASPPAGSYAQTISVTLSSDQPDTELFYRRDGGAWQAYARPVSVFGDTRLQYYASLSQGLANSPIEEAQYTISTATENLDSDRDDVPDYVEEALGLNPGGGVDEDGDGVSDLEEILAGTDPTLANDFPNPGSRTPLDQANSFTLAVSFGHPSQVGGALNQSKTGVPLRLYRPTGERLAEATTQNLGRSDLRDPAARFAAPILAREDDHFYLLSTSETFPLDGDADGEPNGRRLLAVLPVPELAQPDVNYPYDSEASLAQNAQGWIAAAQAAFSNAERIEVVFDADSLFTLDALLVEASLNSRLPQKDDRSLFPFTNNAPNRNGFTDTEVTGQQPEVGLDPGKYVVEPLLAGVRDSSIEGQPQLVDLVAQVYGAHAAFTESQRSQDNIDRPLTTLQGFVAGQALTSPYLGAITLTSTEVQDARDAVDTILNRTQVPSAFAQTLVVTGETFSGPYTTLDNLLGQAFSLFDPQGRALSFPNAMQLPPGAEIQVVGLRDERRDADVPGKAVLVDSVLFLESPRPTVEDSDGDLLADSWERAFAGGLSTLDGFGVNDGSGYSNLQQFFSGSHPLHGGDVPGSPPVDLSPPQVDFAFMENGRLRASWEYPTAYADAIKFETRTTSKLSEPFTDAPVSSVETSPGQFRFEIPNPTADTAFYRLRMQLQP